MRLVDDQQVAPVGIVEEAAQVDARVEDVVEVADHGARAQRQREARLERAELVVARALGDGCGVEHALVRERVGEPGGGEPLAEASLPRAAALRAAELGLRADAVLRRDLHRERAAAGRQHAPERVERELLLRRLRRREEDPAILVQRAHEERMQRGGGLADSRRRGAEQHEPRSGSAFDLADHLRLNRARSVEREGRHERVPRDAARRVELRRARHLPEAFVQERGPGLVRERDAHALARLVEQRERDHRGSVDALAAQRDEKCEEASPLDRARGAGLGVVVGKETQDLDAHAARAVAHDVRAAVERDPPAAPVEIRVDAHVRTRARAERLARRGLEPRAHRIRGRERDARRAGVDQVVDAERERALPLIDADQASRTLTSSAGRSGRRGTRCPCRGAARAAAAARARPGCSA